MRARRVTNERTSTSENVKPQWVEEYWPDAMQKLTQLG